MNMADFQQKLCSPKDGSDAGKGGLSAIQDFYLEFFGTLLPGVIGVSSIVALGLAVCMAVGSRPLVFQVCKTMATSWEIGLLFLAFSYVIGAIAYRMTPKVPDTISSHRQWMATRNGTSKDEVGRLSVTFDESKAIPRGWVERIRFWWNREQWILHHGGDNIDYPYPNMRQYLCCRGLDNLARYIPWCAGPGGYSFKDVFKKGICSKNYVNIIKQRLRNSGRKSLILDMVRNECNIRMLSSIWYILRFVRKLLLWALPAVFAMFLFLKVCGPSGGDEKLMPKCQCPIQRQTSECAPHGSAGNSEEKCPCIIGESAETHRIAWFVFGVFVSIILTTYGERKIEQGFHYVRTREVAMILETAFILENIEFLGDRTSRRHDAGDTPFDLFADMKRQAEAFKETHCKICKCWETCYKSEMA